MDSPRSCPSESPSSCQIVLRTFLSAGRTGENVDAVPREALPLACNAYGQLPHTVRDKSSYLVDGASGVEGPLALVCTWWWLRVRTP